MRRREARLWHVLAALALCVAGCAESRTRGVHGGETHFLVCEQDSDCDALGSDFSCGQAGVCVPTGASLASGSPCDGAGCAPASSGQGEPGQGGGATGAGEVAPLVMLLVDTSGSMERLSGCDCETPGCEECLPRCGGIGSERNRWAQVLEALTGSFEDFTCDALARTAENGMTYDRGYYMPYNRPVRSAQAADGVLDVFADRLRFGLATFDGWDTYMGAAPLVPVGDFDVEASRGVDGLWSYSPGEVMAQAGSFDLRLTGLVFFPNCTTPYFMDTGIRSALAEHGALRAAVDPDDARAINAAIQDDLLDVRPYGGTPIAAGLSDLDAYLRFDPASAAEREAPARERHIVLVTDGYPDDDFRQYGCNCARDQDPSERDYCGGGANDPSRMHCPYDLPEEAALRLRCGLDLEACDDDIVDAVHVVGLSIDDAMVTQRLEAIAAAGGTTARFAGDGAELRDVLQEVLVRIAGN